VPDYEPSGRRGDLWRDSGVSDWTAAVRKKGYMKNYGITKRVNLSLPETRRRVEEGLRAEGFGLLTEVDMQDTLRKKLNIETERYIILGACHPTSAHKALQAEKMIGLLLPCNVILYEEGNQTVVSFFNPAAVIGPEDHPDLVSVAEDIGARFSRIAVQL
jgi:uncharacterized protein (DUF302 family)